MGNESARAKRRFLYSGDELEIEPSDHEKLDEAAKRIDRAVRSVKLNTALDYLNRAINRR